MKLIAIVLCLIANSIFALETQAELRFQTVCYDGYGCFTTSPPFFDLLLRPISYLPQSPDKIGTRFFLYTRNNQTSGVQINLDDPSSYFNANRPTRFIVHGFLANGFTKWITDMKNAILKVEDSNVIAVDWAKGSVFPYQPAVANTQIVGVEIARLVTSYIGKGILRADDVHIIGHSLGAHIAGYAGARIQPKIGRITGLDPAGPDFENIDPVVRLDPTDAQFVDAIHTDGAATLQLGLGLMQRVGHVDFYPNGGKDQPKCPPTSGKLLGAIFSLISFDMNGIEDSVACSHTAAVHFYTASIEKQACSYAAYPCKSLKDFNAGNCIDCSANGCNTMGHWASPSKDRGSLYFTTQDATSYPFCYSHYKLKATSNNLSGQVKTKGKFTLTLKGSLRSSSEFVLEDGSTIFTTNSVVHSLAESSRDIGSIQGATLKFQKEFCFLFCFVYDDKWSFKTIEVIDGQTQQLIRLCPNQAYVSTNGSLEFSVC